MGSSAEGVGARPGEVRLSVVIPTWNAARLAEKAVSNLWPVPEGDELLVVDDASTDDTAAHLEATFGADSDRFRVLVQPINRGFGASLNAGFRESRGSYLTCLNNDALVDWDTLSTVADFLDQTPRAAAASPRLVDPENRPQRVAFDFPRTPWAWLARRLAGGVSNQGKTGVSTRPAAESAGPSNGHARDEPATYLGEYLRAVCVVFRREALAEVGLFDEQFGMFAEDIDLFRRLAKAGWQAWVVPAVVAQHEFGSSTRNNPDRALSSRFRRQSYRSICRFYRKHYTWVTAWVLRMTLAVRVTGRLLTAFAKAAVGRQEWWWVREHGRCLAALLAPCRSEPQEGSL